MLTDQLNFARKQAREAVMRLAAVASCAVVLLASLVGASVAMAQSFPEEGRTITLMVPYAAGGTVDGTARLMAAGLEEELGTTVQVVNKPGAASQVAMTTLLQADPDGYTLSYAVLPTVITHYMDPERGAAYAREDFQKIGLHFVVPALLAVRTDSPYQTVGDLVAAARENPGGIKVSDSGLMATPHMQLLMLELAEDVKFASVHFDGGAPSVTALLGGHVDVLAGSVGDAVPNVKAGNFRGLGIADTESSAYLPDVPTMASEGIDVVTYSATGIVGPPGMPEQVVSRLSEAMEKVIASDEHQERLTQYGVTSRHLGPDDYDAFWADYEGRIGPVIEVVRAN
jgi:tripartite-type tricarboxylate transporter receptor subunit TctC